MLLSQECGIVPVCSDEDMSAEIVCDTVNMGKYNHACFIFVTDSGVAAGGSLTIEGAAADGSHTTALTFAYRYGGAAVGSAGADVLTTPVLATTCAIGDLDDYVIVAEIDADEMYTGTTYYPYLTAVFDGAGAAAGQVSGVCILSQPRYEKDIMPTAIPTT